VPTSCALVERVDRIVAVLSVDLGYMNHVSQRFASVRTILLVICIALCNAFAMTMTTTSITVLLRLNENSCKDRMKTS